MPTERPPEVLDAVFDGLSDGRRRLVCRVLADGGGPTPFDELVDAVVARERPTDGSPSAARETVAVDLRHVQLPKLDDVGIAEYDADGGTVAYRADETVKELLRYDARFADR